MAKQVSWKISLKYFENRIGSIPVGMTVIFKKVNLKTLHMVYKTAKEYLAAFLCKDIDAPTIVHPHLLVGHSSSYSRGNYGRWKSRSSGWNDRDSVCRCLNE